MSLPDSKREDEFAELLAGYDQVLQGETPRRALDSSAIESDPELAVEWDGAKACLELLDRVRRHWSPLADQDTPALWQTSELATPVPGPPVTLGRFHIVRELGRGGLGMVYMAFDPQLGRHVALKVPRPEALASTDLRRRFLREAKAAARLSHPNLVTVHEAGEIGPICYIAAEYCPGLTLRDWLNEQPDPVAIETAAQITMQLAQAVQHAHGRGVLHRDIKPGNVMIDITPARSATSTGFEEPAVVEDGLCPKLTDFGMAKLLELTEDQTYTGVIVGTPAYMAPEQAKGRGDDVDARADVYALGVILYELLTDRRPHEGKQGLDLVRAVLYDDPVAPRVWRTAISRDLEAIVLQCLAKKPGDRYATAQQLADDLAHFLAGEPTQARPPGVVGTLWKWARRRPAMAVLLGVLAVSTAALFGVVIAYNARLSDEAARADAARDVAEREVEASRRLLYSADVRLAFESFKANNVVQALDLLNRHTPKRGQEDLREFCWHYLHDLCEPQTLELKGHTGSVMSVAFSPDGRTIATGSEDGTARVWDALTGKQLHDLRGHTTEVDCVAFSPDGHILAAGEESGTVRLWDPRTAAQGDALRGHTDHVLAVAFSPDGKWLASGSRDMSVRIWNPITGADVVTLTGEMDVVRSVAFSPAGDFLYAVDEAERLHVWRTEGWQRLPGAISAREKFFALAVSRDGSRIAAAGRREIISVWQRGNGAPEIVDELQSGHSEWIQSLAFSPVDDTLVSGGKDGCIRFWQLGQAKCSGTLLGHQGRIWSVAWSPDGRRLASASAEKTVKVWSVARAAGNDFPLLVGKVFDAEFLADSATLLTACGDGAVRIWNIEDHSLRSTIQTQHRQVHRIAASADESLFAVRGEDRTTVVLQRESLEELWSSPRAGTSGVPLCWAPSDHRLAVGVADRTIALINLDSGAVEGLFEHASSVRSAIFTADGRQLATASQSLQIWDVQSQRVVHGLPLACHDLAIDPDRNLLAASSGSQIEVIDTQTGQVLSTLVTVGSEVERVAIGGATLAAALSQPSAVTLWDIRTGQMLMTLEVDASKIIGLRFSPDHRHLVATGTDGDGHGRIWQWSIRNRR